MDKPRKAIDNLNHLLIGAENNPILSNIFSLKKQTIRRSKSDSVKSFGEEEIVNVKKEIKYLDSLPVEQIRLKLGSENYSVSGFQAIASELRIRFKKKVNKEILVEQITSKIINFRGYRLLSGESENKW